MKLPYYAPLGPFSRRATAHADAVFASSLYGFGLSQGGKRKLPALFDELVQEMYIRDQQKFQHSRRVDVARSLFAWLLDEELMVYAEMSGQYTLTDLGVLLCTTMLEQDKPR